ncbi:hypothetical protein KDI_48900 [Dictyobacter arantiisoli]|uniref:Uncharacterized protein n=2 Tax=Dictyobacter arantiisoli TaxID=2014874 RepID=A0A5A5TJS3_9CHLR|nr:hypothetical protein KDI_48900 [Dictyobacter arantiisoli]
MISTFCAFFVFALAYLGLMHVIDPFPPFALIHNQHPDLKIAYQVIVIGAELSLLILLLGGCLILCVAFRNALLARRRDILFFLSGACILVGLFIGASWLARDFLAGNAVFSGIYVLIGLASALFSIILLAKGILRSEFDRTTLRLTVVATSIMLLTMLISLLGTLVWTLRLWADVPQFAIQQGITPGFAGGLGGSTGVGLAILMMAFAIGCCAWSLFRDLRTTATSALS